MTACTSDCDWLEPERFDEAEDVDGELIGESRKQSIFSTFQRRRPLR